VENVVPECVEAIPTLLQRTHQPRLLRLVFGDEDNLPLPRNGARVTAGGRQNVVMGLIEDLLRGVESQAIEMKLLNPIAGVGNEELAYRSRVRSVEINRVAPLVLVLVAEICGGESAKIVSH